MNKEKVIKQNKNNIQRLVEKLTLFDDDLMAMVFDGNIPATQLVLRIVLQREDLDVIEVIGQKELESPVVGGRVVRLDIKAKDKRGKKYNIEVQRKRSGAHVRRARFHSSMIDSRMLREGQDFIEIKDSYVIFITERDYFRKGLPLYTIERYIRETGEEIQDGSHIVYVNGSYRGNDALGKLMADFHERDAEKMHYPELAGSIKQFKAEGGQSKMCEAVEEYARSVARDAAIETEIEAGIDYGAEKSYIISRLCKKFVLSQKEAEDVYENYLKELNEE